MTKTSRDLICHTRKDGRQCLRRKGTKICGGVCGYCQPNCQHSRIKVNERTLCIHRLCLRLCLTLNILYTSDVSQNMTHVEHCTHQMCFRTCLTLNTLYTSDVSQNMSHVEYFTHQMCLRTCLMLNTVHIRCLRTCLMLNNLYTSAVPQNMPHVEHPL